MIFEGYYTYIKNERRWLIWVLCRGSQIEKVYRRSMTDVKQFINNHPHVNFKRDYVAE